MASNLLMPILKSHSNAKGKWSSSGKGHSHSQKTWAKKIKLNSMRYLTRQRAVGSFFQIIKSLLSRRSKSTRHPSSRTLWSREKPRIVKACAEQVVKLISPTKVRCLRLLRLTMMTSHMAGRRVSCGDEASLSESKNDVSCFLEFLHSNNSNEESGQLFGSRLFE